MKEAIRDINWPKLRNVTINVSVTKFYRVSQNHTPYTQKTLLHGIVIYYVITKCFQYDDQFRPSRDP